MMRRTLRILLFLIPVAAAAWFGQRLVGSTTTALSGGDAVSVPTARVVRGPVDLTFYGTGNVGATKTMVISAPVVGATLRLTSVPTTGDAVKMDDVLMEFDPTEQEYQLEQAQLDLAEAEQNVAKMRADTQVQESQDQLTLLTAKFDVRRAQMDAVPMPGLVAANDVERRRLSLEEAQRRLVQVQDDVKSRTETTKAQLAVVQERRARVKANADRAKMAIDSLIVKAPMDGLIVVRENRDLGGEMFGPGMSLPEYRAGDNVSPGRPIADIFDVLQMEIRSRVSEGERTNIASGQPAIVRSHALPGVALKAHVTAIAGLAARADMTTAAVREFDMMLRLDQPDERVRPGTSVDLVVQGSHLENVLSVPRQAIFDKNGQSVVYIRTANGFEARPVKLQQRTEALAIVADLAEGSEVALVDPEIAARMAPASKSGPVTTQGGK